MSPALVLTPFHFYLSVYHDTSTHRPDSDRSKRTYPNESSYPDGPWWYQDRGFRHDSSKHKPLEEVGVRGKESSDVGRDRTQKDGLKVEP